MHHGYIKVFVFLLFARFCLHNPVTVWGPFFIQSLYNCHFLDLKDQSLCLGTRVVATPFSNHSSQKWEFYDFGNGFMIVNVMSGLAMDIEYGGGTGIKSGANITVWPANYAKNQRWRMDNEGVIQSAESTMSLELCNYLGGNMTQVIATPRHGWISQKFRTVAIKSVFPKYLF